MGAAAAPVAAVSSIASLGMSAMSDVAKGRAGQAQAQGVAAADEFQASRLERAAEYGRVQAAQTGAVLTERLNTTLGNIDAVRAAAHTDPSSPTGIAMTERASFLGERSRDIQVGNILGQVSQEESDAAYLRRAGTYALMQGNYALTQGKTQAFIDIAGGLGKSLGQPTFGVG